MWYFALSKHFSRPGQFIFYGLLLTLFNSITWAFEEVSTQTTIDEKSIQSLGLEDLMNIEVTSVAKKQQSLSNTAAATFVITQEDIRRSGASNIPEALRMAPGINVYRIDSNKWAITSRGFNGRFANKLLVLMDGRTVYTPAYSGVYWEVQDTMMEDIERIEVIRGPGATLWGANAVNGVINIITKNTIETQGGLLSMGAGNHERGFAGWRYGSKLNDDTHARAYIKGFKREEFVFKDGGGANDDWTMFQTGGRIDSQLNMNDTLTVQGDYYQGNIQDNQSIPLTTPPYYKTADDSTDVTGGNLLTRWQHSFSLTSDFSLQVYYDYTKREENFTDIRNDIFDIDFQHRFSPQEQHDIVWGLGYRYTKDDFQRFPGSISPQRSTLQLFNTFIQDEITLIDNTLWLTIGSKFEHNKYTDWEIQPSVRLFWNLHPQHKLWSSVSRAARTPSRFEHNSRILHGVLPPDTGFNTTEYYSAFAIEGNKDFDSEKVTAYEIGYRINLIHSLSIDTTLFYNEYDDLQGYRFETPYFDDGLMKYHVPIVNNRTAYTSGFELASNWQLQNWWSLDLAYTYYKENIHTKSFEVLVSENPKNLLSLRSNMTIRDGLELDLWLKYTSESKVLNHIGELTKNDAYTTLDARIAWRPEKNIELSLVGQNLLNSEHVETVDPNIFDTVEIERGIYFKVLWQY